MKAFIDVDRRQALATGLGAASWLALGGESLAAGPARKVDIVMTQGVTGLVIHEIAKSQGFFAQYGVEPNVLLVSDGGKCVAALISGASQLCIYSGFSQLIPAIERGAKVKILAGALNVASLAMYSGKADIRKVSDLQGKTIGIGAPGSVVHQMTVMLLRKKGVDVSKIQFRNVGSNADIFKAVAAKTVDAGLGDVEVFDQQQKFGVHALPDGLLWKEIPEYTNQATYASEAAIAKDRDLLVRTLAAYDKAYRFVSGPTSKDAYLRARATVTGSKDVQQAVSQWSWIQKTQPYALDLVLSDDRINLVQKLNAEFKVQQKMLPVGQITDMSLARDALKIVR